MNQNNNALNGLLAGMAIVLICLIVLALVFVVLWVLFCLTLQRMQSAVRRRNQLIPPGLVWLHFLHLGQVIPFAGWLVSLGAYVWDLVMVLKLSGSLEREFRDRGWRTTGTGYGKVVGLVWTVSGICTTLVNAVFAFVRPAAGNRYLLIGVGVAIIALWLVSLVCWIVYWVQMAGYGRQLREGRRGYRTGSVEEDFDDDQRGPLREYPPDDADDFDRPRRRRREDPDDEDDDRRGRRRWDDD